MAQEKKILVSGIVNVEVNVPVGSFPLAYTPVVYDFFGLRMGPGAVASNVALALTALGDEVRLCAMTGDDAAGALVREGLRRRGVSTEAIRPLLRETPLSAVLYDAEGRRRIHTDLKDAQEAAYPFDAALYADADMACVCNANFNRPLLPLLKAAGIPIATDVHVLSRVDDPYNEDFLRAADWIFLSDEGLPGRHDQFLYDLGDAYAPRGIILGRGAKGASFWDGRTGRVSDWPAASLGPVVNTVGAGDALFSAFVHFLRRGRAPEEALRCAQVFAAMKIRVSGAGEGFAGEAEVLARL